MSNPGKPSSAAVSADSILKNEMTTIHADPDAIAKEGYDTLARFD
jgi:hypothetical protein